MAQGADLLHALCAARGLTPHPRTWRNLFATIVPLRSPPPRSRSARLAPAKAARSAPPWRTALACRRWWAIGSPRSPCVRAGVASSVSTAIHRPRPAPCSSTAPAPARHRRDRRLAPQARRTVGVARRAHQCRNRRRLHASHHGDRHSACRRSGAVLRQYPARGFRSRVSAPESAVRVASAAVSLIRREWPAGNRNSSIPRPAYRNRQTQRENP